MKVILNQTIENLGSIGEVVSVRDGYARNFLIPQKKAILADGSNLKQREHLMKIIEKKAAKEKATLMDIAAKLNKFKAQFREKVGEEGKLFGSVTTMDIEKKLVDAGYAIDKKQIMLEHPIKKIGVHEAKIKLGKSIVATIKVSVIAEEEPKA